MSIEDWKYLAPLGMVFLLFVYGMNQKDLKRLENNYKSKSISDEERGMWKEKWDRLNYWTTGIPIIAFFLLIVFLVALNT